MNEKEKQQALIVATAAAGLLVWMNRNKLNSVISRGRPQVQAYGAGSGLVNVNRELANWFDVGMTDDEKREILSAGLPGVTKSDIEAYASGAGIGGDLTGQDYQLIDQWVN